MRDRRLRDVASVREVAGADPVAIGELPDDGQANRVGEGLKELDVRVERALHGGILLDGDRY